MELKSQNLFTLLEIISASESEDFDGGNVSECFEIEGENSECIVEKVINIYKNRKEEFKKNKIYVDSCSSFEVGYQLTTHINGYIQRHDLWSDIYREHEELFDVYICKMNHHTTKKMKQKMLKFIEKTITDQTD